MGARKGQRPVERRETAEGANVSVFERKSNRRHFDVLGRKVKGANASVSLARSEASERRKRTLLLEYRQQGRAGGFIDRRFGEADADADADEKALQRLQRLRQMQFGRASRFALGDEGDEEQLTHFGTALNDLDGADDFVPSEGEDDGELDALITREYHFGGGLFARKEGGTEAEGEDALAPRSKKDVMLEIIAKSKSAKRERVQAKEADDEQLGTLDQTFKALADAGVLRTSLRTGTGHMKPARGSGRHAPREAEPEEGDDFDALAMELANDRRASRVADRLKTAEETAAEDAAKLLELERQRLKRMRQRGSDDDVSDGEDDAPKGGYAAKRMRRTQATAKPRKETGDAAEDDFVAQEPGADQPSDGEGSSEESEEEGEPDDLRVAFKKRVGDIAPEGNLHRGLRRLRRLGILHDGGDAGSSSDEEAEESEESAEEESEESAEEEILEVEMGAEAEPEAEAPPARLRQPRSQDALPFTFEAPATHAQLLALVGGRSAAELGEVVQRIRTCTAISLAPANRQRLQVFFGVLLLHFDALAQEAPPPAAHLDALLPHLLALSREVPFYAAQAVQTRLARMQRAAADALAAGTPRWPPARGVALLRLAALLFPTSDFRHAVLTPAALLVGQYLAHCEVRCRRDAGLGVLLASLAQALVPGRFMPEALAFLVGLVHASATGAGSEATAGLAVHVAQQQGEGGWLTPSKQRGGARSAALLDPVAVLGLSAEDAYWETAAFRDSALLTALRTLNKVAGGVAALPAGAALTQPVHAAVTRLLASPSARHLSSEAAAAANTCLEAHARALSAVHAPLQLHRRAPEAIKTFNPRFEEEGFVQGRSYDIDRERAEQRTLRKQVARETKGAARELRKDNRFLAEERSRALGAETAEREGRVKAAMSFLEAQEADFKSGGQGGAVKRKKRV